VRLAFLFWHRPLGFEEPKLDVRLNGKWQTDNSKLLKVGKGSYQAQGQEWPWKWL